MLPDLPSNLAAAMILVERAARLAAQARAEEASAARHNLDIEIERLKLEIARLRRERYGSSAERLARIEQLELSLEELEATAAEADAAAEMVTGNTEARNGWFAAARRADHCRLTCHAAAWSIRRRPRALLRRHRAEQAR